MDPGAACPKLKGLAAIEARSVEYMEIEPDLVQPAEQTVEM